MFEHQFVCHCFLQYHCGCVLPGHGAVCSVTVTVACLVMVLFAVLL